MLTRRRFLTLTACAAMARPAGAGPAPKEWRGIALGADVVLRVEGGDPRAARAFFAESARVLRGVEDRFSLYRGSDLTRLNALGRLAHPSDEFTALLTLAGQVHAATGGAFDPTVQPLWALWAEAAANGRRPDAGAIEAVLRRTGWDKVRLDAAAITLAPGTALTLNGIGQGYVADRVAALLEAEGLSNILIDTGELRALGGRPDGGNWPVRLETGERLSLRQRALATSAPLGTTFDQAGRDGHILDPATGMPTASAWRSVSISAPSAAIADALATAACLMSEPEAIRAMLGHFEGARLEASA